MVGLKQITIYSSLSNSLSIFKSIGILMYKIDSRESPLPQKSSCGKCNKEWKGCHYTFVKGKESFQWSQNNSRRLHCFLRWEPQTLVQEGASNIQLKNGSHAGEYPLHSAKKTSDYLHKLSFCESHLMKWSVCCSNIDVKGQVYRGGRLFIKRCVMEENSGYCACHCTWPDCRKNL